MSLQFRPHHFLCTLGFEGKGYSDDFVRNFQDIADLLRKNGEEGDRTPIEVVEATDSICQPCPNRLTSNDSDDSTCATEAKIRTLDQAHMAVLGIKGGDVLTWGDAKKLISEKMTIDAHRAACAPCSWRSLGLCESALRRLQESGT